MLNPLPPGWTEVIVTGTEFQRELCTGKYHPRVEQDAIFRLMFKARGIRMAGPFTLELAPPFELFHDQGGNRVIARQGPAA